MKRVFVLEDDFTRVNFLREYFGDICEFHFAYDLNYAKRSFSFDYDMIMLDHDLDDIDITKSGYFFCKWLVVSSCKRDVPIVIHSMNIVGARNMQNTLKDAGFTNVTILPFYTLLKKWDEGVLSFFGNYKFNCPEN